MCRGERPAGRAEGQKTSQPLPGGATHKNPEEVTLSSGDIDYYLAIALRYLEGAGAPQSFTATSTLTVPVTFASFEARGLYHRPGHGGDRCLVEDAVCAREGLHKEVEAGDAPLDEGHPGVVEEMLDLLPPPGGEVVDDDDVVVLS